MIKIIRYFHRNEIPLLLQIVTSSTVKCSKFKIVDNKLYQQAFDEEKWTNCEMLFRIAELDEQFSEYVISTIMNAHKIVPAIKTSDPYESQTYGVKLGGKIEGIVSALVNKILYENNENGNIGIFDFVATLLYRIVKAHAFHNGNKRTAILSISYILNAFGFYIVWANKSEIYIKVWEDLMILIASSSNMEKEITAKIKEKLIKST